MLHMVDQKKDQTRPKETGGAAVFGKVIKRLHSCSFLVLSLHLEAGEQGRGCLSGLHTGSGTCKYSSINRLSTQELPHSPSGLSFSSSCTVHAGTAGIHGSRTNPIFSRKGTRLAGIAAIHSVANSEGATGQTKGILCTEGLLLEEF